MVEVVVGALVRDGRVLLVHRRPDKHAFPDTWDLPGGVVEAGESELDALVRELDEELGVSIDASTVSALCGVDLGTASLSAWLVPDWVGEPHNVAPEEHDDLAWFGLEDLPPLAHGRVRAAVAEAMREGR
ncbi:NUDIX domain-containing protein [Nocardioides oleivorans]|uniref:8-oxo-dGTP diphosphatase n=1 Tax=Nocardioides oleivorans TaxID=273676 RepID=A0A4V1RKV3_9ACTN|nr:NUDIX domain-containing protein [Nocardioides oleivorans]RYB93582.1 NUDIX domain-containing protein [Nocardioides oleivorans]